MRMRSMSCVTVAGVVVALASAGCTVGPDYVRPSAEAPALYKEMPPAKSAEPADTSPKGPWWTVYGDAQLNTLEEGVAAANQNLRVAEANYRQAQTLVQQARAGLYPTIGANVNATRARAASRTQSFYTLGLPVDWEVDLWGKVRRSVEANEASAQASAAELEATLLSLQAQLAQSYFALRIADRDKKLLDETVTAYTRSLELTQNRYKAGVAARVWTQADELWLAVSDRGCGFVPEQAELKGRLGLASMRERAELLGGSMWIETRLGHGTTVRLSWPLQEADDRVENWSAETPAERQAPEPRALVAS